MIFEMVEGVAPFDKNERAASEREIQSNVEKQRVEFNKETVCSYNLRNLIFKLLEKNPEQRLGAGEKDSEEILAHPYFEGVNVTDFLSLKMKAPYKPQMEKGKK